MKKPPPPLWYSPSYAGPMHPEAVLPDRALCLPTFRHLVIGNKTPLSFQSQSLLDCQSNPSLPPPSDLSRLHQMAEALEQNALLAFYGKKKNLKSQCPSTFSMSRLYESTSQEFVPVSLLVNFWSKDGPLRFRLECATYLKKKRIVVCVCVCVCVVRGGIVCRHTNNHTHYYSGP